MAFAGGSPMGGQLEIGIALVLQDRFSNQAREASSAIKGLHQDAKNAIAANLQTLDGFANRGLAVAMNVGRGFASAVEEAATFRDTMVTVEAITAATRAQLGKLDLTAKNLGLATMFNAQDIAGGMKFLAMAGATADEINGMITGAAYVAGATGLNLEGKGGAADVITNVMRTFRIESASAAQVVGDMLAKGTLSANMSMSDLAESIRYAAADMVNLKMELPQVIAMIGALGDSGIQGSMAGTALSNMARYTMKSIVQNDYKGAKALAMLGLTREDLTDAKGELLDFSLVLTKMAKAMDGKDIQSLERAGVFLDIFGVRGNRAAVALLNNMDRYRELLNKIINESAGFAEKVVKMRMDEPLGQLDVMKESIKNLMISFGLSLWPVVKPFITSITWVLTGVRKLFETSAGPFVAGLTAVAVAALGIASAFVKIRTKWLILQNDSQITGRNMFTLLMGGWNAATLSAQRYLAMEGAILAQREAGILASGGVAALQGAGMTGYLVKGTNTQAKLGSNGRWYAQTGRGATGWTTVPKASVAAATGKMAAGALMGGAAMGAAAGVARASIGRALVSVGGKLIGALGGPWGLALMGISILLPKVIQAISGNRNSQDENTTAVNTLAENMKAERDSRTPEEYRNLQMVEEMRALVNALYFWAGNIGNNKPVTNISLYQDGRKTFEDVISERDARINLSMGTK